MIDLKVNGSSTFLVNRVYTPPSHSSDPFKGSSGIINPQQLLPPDAMRYEHNTVQLKGKELEPEHSAISNSCSIELSSQQLTSFDSKYLQGLLGDN
jgi:hypothetical protein